MRLIFYFMLALAAVSCGNGEPEADAYGNFIATEILVSAENSGKILDKRITEGEVVAQSEIAYVIDTVQTWLKKQELQARRRAVDASRANLSAQIAVLAEQDIALKNDIARFEKMLDEGAVSRKQLDDLKNKSIVIQKQIAQVETNFSSVGAEVSAIDASILQVDDLLDRAVVRTPVKGTILETYSEPGKQLPRASPYLNRRTWIRWK